VHKVGPKWAQGPGPRGPPLGVGGVGWRGVGVAPPPIRNLPQMSVKSIPHTTRNFQALQAEPDDADHGSGNTARADNILCAVLALIKELP